MNLAFTKIGQRNAANEALTILDPLVKRLWMFLNKVKPFGTHPDNYICSRHEQRFRDFIARACWGEGTEQHGFRPYSIRRGGATAYHRLTADMQRTIDRGRWASIRVSELYICDGLGRQVEMQFLPQQRLRWRDQAREVSRFLAQQNC